MLLFPAHGPRRLLGNDVYVDELEGAHLLVEDTLPHTCGGHLNDVYDVTSLEINSKDQGR